MRTEIFVRMMSKVNLDAKPTILPLLKWMSAINNLHKFVQKWSCNLFFLWSDSIKTILTNSLSALTIA